MFCVDCGACGNSFPAVLTHKVRWHLSLGGLSISAGVSQSAICAGVLETAKLQGKHLGGLDCRDAYRCGLVFKSTLRQLRFLAGVGDLAKRRSSVSSKLVTVVTCQWNFDFTLDRGLNVRSLSSLLVLGISFLLAFSGPSWVFADDFAGYVIVPSAVNSATYYRVPRRFGAAPNVVYSLPPGQVSSFSAVPSTTYVAAPASVTYTITALGAGSYSASKSSAKGAKVQIQILDANGNVLKSGAKAFAAGDGTIEISPDDLFGDGAAGGNGGGGQVGGDNSDSGSATFRKTQADTLSRLDKLESTPKDQPTESDDSNATKLPTIDWQKVVGGELNRIGLKLTEQERKLLLTVLDGLDRDAAARKFRNRREFREFLRTALETAGKIVDVSSPGSKAVGILDLIRRTMLADLANPAAAPAAAGNAVPAEKSFEASLSELRSAF